MLIYIRYEDVHINWGECSLQRQGSINHSTIPLTLEVPSLATDISSVYLQDIPPSWQHQPILSPVCSPLTDPSPTTNSEGEHSSSISNSVQESPEKMVSIDLDSPCQDDDNQPGEK